MMYIYSNILSFSLFYTFCHYFFHKRNNNITFHLLIYSATFILKYFFNVLNIPQINILCSLSVYLLLSLILYKDSFIYKILLILIYFTLSIVSESITFIIFGNYINNCSQYVQITISKIVLLILVSITFKLKKIKDDNINFKSMLCLAVQPFIIIVLLYMTNGNIDAQSKSNIMLTITLGLLLLSNLASFYIINEILLKKKIEKELTWQKENEKNNKEYLEQMKNNLQLYKSFKHDWKHHLNIMSSMLQKGEIYELEKYINQISDSVISSFHIVTGDEFLDLILITKINKINAAKINMIYEVRKLQIEYISKIDLNIIYSNILDNAIESCSCINSKNRFIKIQTKEENNRYQIIKITNSCEKVNSNLSTLKADKENHGFGIKNVETTVQKYNGQLYTKYKENEQVFVTTIIFDKFEKL